MRSNLRNRSKCDRICVIDQSAIEFQFCRQRTSTTTKYKPTTHETNSQTPRLHHHRHPKRRITSLYNYLIQHPQIAPATEKEVHYFDLNFDKSPDWYYAHFPQPQNGLNKITGEASPYYIFHPHVPQRIYDLCPQVKIIALLRNPVERAISHYYYYYIKIQYETLSLEEAIACRTRKTQRRNGILANPNYYSYPHQHYSYLSRGIYADQLPAWMKLFPKSQISILKSEDLYSNPSEIFNTVLDF